MNIEKTKKFKEEKDYLVSERNIEEGLILELEKEVIKKVKWGRIRKVKFFKNGHTEARILDEYKLVLVYYYDKKSDTLYFENIVKYDAVNYKWFMLSILIHFVVYIVVLFKAFTQKSVRLIPSKMMIGINVILGIILVACMLIVCHCKKFKYNKLDKRSWFDNSFNPYLSFLSGRLFGALLFFYITLQSWLVLYSYYSVKHVAFIPLCAYLLYSIYFILNLVKSILDMMQMDIVALALFIGLPLILGTITDDNWNLAALFITLLYLLISKDIWRLQAGRTEPHLRYNLDDEVIKNNIYRSKVLISVMSIIVYILVKIRKNFFNENSMVYSMLPKEIHKLYKIDIFSKKLFLGIDFFAIIFVGLIIVHALNFIISKSRGKTLEQWIISPTIAFIVNSIEKQIYKGARINETEELLKKPGSLKKAGKRNHRRI